MQTTSPYLPGGTASLLLGKTISRIEPHCRGGDEMGRWSFITLRRSHRPPLVIYTVYQVNRSPTNQLGTTAWHQQRLQLDQKGQHHIHPRNAFIQDLISQIKIHQQQNYEIILGGDFNDTLTTPRSNILQLSIATNLIDPWTRIYPTLEDFNTYQRGTKRIDAVFCSPSLIPYITTLAYTPFNWFTSSDHRGTIIDFNATALFGDTNAIPIPTLNLRGCRSNDRQQVATLIHQWHRHLRENNASKLIDKLTSNTATTNDTETLDRLIGQGGDSGE